MSLPLAKKHLGQHFLKDKNVIEKISNDYANSSSGIIEVGPGPGILSEKLKEHKIPYFVIEKDRSFNEYLIKHMQDENITFADALDIDWHNFINDKFTTNEQTSIWMVSNLPYNISVPLLISFIKTAKMKYLTLMFQKEVADKICKNGSNNANSLNTITSCYFEFKKLCKVGTGAFIPPPKVQSTVISFQRRSDPLVPIEEFRKLESFLRSLFAHKRKQLLTVLKSAYGVSTAKTILEHSSIEQNLRAETLEIEQILTLYQHYKNCKELV